MSATNAIEIVATLTKLAVEINALPEGAARQALHSAYGELISLLADAGYDLRPGYNLPAA